MKVLESLVLITFLLERSPVTAQSTTINSQELSQSVNKESLCSATCQELIEKKAFYYHLDLRNTTICQDLKHICSQEGFQGCKFTWELDLWPRKESENALRLKIENCQVNNLTLDGLGQCSNVTKKVNIRFVNVALGIIQEGMENSEKMCVKNLAFWNCTIDTIQPNAFRNVKIYQNLVIHKNSSINLISENVFDDMIGGSLMIFNSHIGEISSHAFKFEGGLKIENSTILNLKKSAFDGIKIVSGQSTSTPRRRPKIKLRNISIKTYEKGALKFDESWNTTHTDVSKIKILQNCNCEMDNIVETNTKAGVEISKYLECKRSNSMEIWMVYSDTWMNCGHLYIGLISLLAVLTVLAIAITIKKSVKNSTIRSFVNLPTGDDSGEDVRSNFQSSMVIQIRRTDDVSPQSSELPLESLTNANSVQSQSYCNPKL